MQTAAESSGTGSAVYCSALEFTFIYKSFCQEPSMLRKAVLISVLALSQFGVAQSVPGANMQGTLAKRPFSFEEMMKLKRVEEPVPTPDGKWVLFAAVDVDLEANTKTPHIWVVPLSGGESRKLTNGKEGEDRPRISPDGKTVAFVSAQGGSQQIWAFEFDSANGTMNGEPRKITDIPTEADGEIWSPDGKYLLFTSRVFPDCLGAPAEEACNKERDDATAKSKVQAKIFTRLFYRHWNAYTDYKRSHLFLIDAACAEPPMPTPKPPVAQQPQAPPGKTIVEVCDNCPPVHTCGPRDITPGDYDVPPFSLGGPDDYDISPDGKEVAYTSNHEPVEAISTNNDIWLVSTDCWGEATKCEPRKISTSPGSDSTPRYSPDGKWIAWRMQKRNGYESDKFNLVIYDRKTGEIKNLTEDFDTWVESFLWEKDSKTLDFAADHEGSTPIYAVGLSGGLEGVVRGSNDDLALTPDGRSILFTQM